MTLKQYLKAFKTFFTSRFSLRGDVLWRVLLLLRPYRRSVIYGNIFLALSSTMGAVGLVALFPLFKFILDIQPGEKKEEQKAVETVADPASDAQAAIDDAVRKAQPAVAPEKSTSQETAIQGEREKAPDETGVGSALVSRKLDQVNSIFHSHLTGKVKDWGRRKLDGVLGWARESRSRFIALYIAGIIVLFFLKGGLQFFGDFLMSKAYIQAVRDLMTKTFANVLRQEMAFFDNTSSGDLLNVCYREIFNMRSMFVVLASNRIMEPINMAILFLALLVISLPLSVMLLVLLPLVILPAFLATRYLRSQMKKELGLESEIMDVMNQSFHGIQTVKAFGAENMENALIDPMLEGYVYSTRMRRAAQSFIGPAVDIINMVVMLLVFWLALTIMPKSAMPEPARLMAFMFAITRFYKPLRSIMTMNIRMQRTRAMARRVFNLLDREPAIQDPKDAVDFPLDWKELTFDDVSMQYVTTRAKGRRRIRKVFKDVFQTIRRGESLALVGPNGAGKSSLAHLLIRLYDATGGEIRIGGIPIKEIRLDQLRNHVCMITQHPVLFNRSVSENIAFGMKDVSQEQIEAAARATGADAFINKLPQGYESLVGEGGRQLSGGERQKIALARVLVRDPHIVILDEPTNSLDAQTIDVVLNLVDDLRQRGVTIIMITHDLRQLCDLDRVLQLGEDRTITDITAQIQGRQSELEQPSGA